MFLTSCDDRFASIREASKSNTGSEQGFDSKILSNSAFAAGPGLGNPISGVSGATTMFYEFTSSLDSSYNAGFSIWGFFVI